VGFNRWFAIGLFLKEFTMPISHVFDTHATTAKGKTMHFDVVLDERDAAKALEYAKAWLVSIGESNATLDQRNCLFCHSAEAPADLRAQIEIQGYAIYKLEGCPK
jgi:Domain of unknown function (DUF2024)